MKHAGKLKTIETVINSTAPTIGMFKKEKGRDFTEALIMGWLIYLNSILNLNKPMTEDQIEMCATEVVNEFSFLKITDITFLFKRIISGGYGELYESLTIPKVLTYFRSYFDERCEIAENQTIRNHKDFTSDETFNYSKNIKRILQNGSTTKNSRSK
jgi:hypothetical protein